ncbi:MAG TPA: hypothetical protein VJ824_17360, partial [Bacillota bacterium]|nr:hypothetical protein [Bacillota bacterium]
MNSLNQYRYDGLVWLQCSVLFIKSIAFIFWVKELIARSEPMNFVQMVYAFPLHLPLYLAVLSFIFLAKRKLVAGLILNFLLSLLLFIDLIYFRAFGLPTSWFSISGLGNLGEVGNTIVGLIHPGDLLLIVDLILWGVIYVRQRKREGWITPVKWSRFGIYFTFSLLLGYMEYAQSGLMEKILSFRYKPLYAIEKIGPLGYHFADSVNFVKDYSHATLAPQQKVQVKNWFDQNHYFNIPSTSAT